MTPRWRLDFLGDSALIVSIDAAEALAANGVVHELAGRVRRAQVPGVRDVVPGMRDLVLHVDPLRCDLAAVRAALDGGSQRVDERPAATTSAFVELPVRYGGEHGPDLDVVAAACGLTPDEVCRRHAAREYVVCFIGFLPGFPYLAPLDHRLRLPRRPTPRPRVPAGSIAIAGEYTGIYPWESPGGWHLIGRTTAALFDVDATVPSLLAPGMRVRFRPAPA